MAWESCGIRREAHHGRPQPLQVLTRALIPLPSGAASSGSPSALATATTADSSAPYTQAPAPGLLAQSHGLLPVSTHVTELQDHGPGGALQRPHAWEVGRQLREAQALDQVAVGGMEGGRVS